MSWVPIIATTSASMWPRTISSSADRCAKPGARHLHPVRLVGAVGDQIDAELALRRLDRGVGLARRHAVAFGEELEVMDQRFHVVLHFLAARRRDLVVLQHHRARVWPCSHFDALPDDAVRLAHLLDAHQVAVVAVAVHAHRDVEVHPVVDRIGLLLAQIPLDARAAQHGPEKPSCMARSGDHHADIDGALLPDAVVGEQGLVFIHACGKARGEVPR